MKTGEKHAAECRDLSGFVGFGEKNAALLLGSGYAGCSLREREGGTPTPRADEEHGLETRATAVRRVYGVRGNRHGRDARATTIAAIHLSKITHCTDRAPEEILHFP